MGVRYIKPIHAFILWSVGVRVDVMNKVVLLLLFCLPSTLHFVASSSIAATPMTPARTATTPPSPGAKTIPRASSAEPIPEVRIFSPPWEKVIDIGYKLIVVIIAVGATVVFFWRGIRYLKMLSCTTKKVADWVEQITPDMPLYKSMATRTNAYMQDIAPEIFKYLEDNNSVPQGTFSKSMSVATKGYVIESASHKKLTEEGERLLQNSGIQKIIDSSLDNFIEALENKQLKSPLEVEEQSLYLLKNENEKDEKATLHLEKYLYNHPEYTKNTILLVGSIYLRDKYLEKHPDILNDRYV